jgi:diguanylate cyclase (GGDEF)-like protein
MADDVQSHLLEETRELDRGPFARPGLGSRILPFALVAIIAEASLALPPGPKSAGFTVLSVGLLGFVAIAILLPWQRLPGWMTVVVPVAYMATVFTLILAVGGATSGVGIVVLIPLMWTVLYHRQWESLVVVGGIVLIEIVTSLTPVRVTDAVLLRRIVFWVAIGLLISVATHSLRDRLRRILAHQETILRRTAALEAAAEELTTIRKPDDVLTAAARLAAELVSAPGTPGRRGQYIRIEGSMARVVAEYDETGQSVTEPFPLSDHPNLQEVMRTGSAVSRRLDLEEVGPRVRELIVTTGVLHGMYVPVYCDGELDGVLSVPLRSTEVSPELLEYCKAFGHLVELALDNAKTHEVLEEQATTDMLTGLANRRAFDHLIDHRPGRLQFSILAIDVDDLKLVNDAFGHGVGDELLIFVARSLSVALRRGDVLARMGGDEFAVLLLGADIKGAREVADRMIATLRTEPFLGESPTVSIGIAFGTPDDDAAAVYAAADKAMYRAKRLGGGQCAFAERLDPEVPAHA